MASQTEIAPGSGSLFGRLLLNIVIMPYSHLTALKIDPLLATAVLSVGMGYYESVQSTSNI